MVYDHPALPVDFREHVYEHIRTAFAKEHKEGETEEQFLYKTRKKGFGDPLKKEWWGLPESARSEIGDALEKKFAFLIDQLAVKGTQAAVAKFVRPAPAAPDLAAEVAACGGKVDLKPDDNPRAD